VAGVRELDTPGKDPGGRSLHAMVEEGFALLAGKKMAHKGQ